MKALMVLVLAVIMTGCSVNVVVAPHAALTIDSANQADNSAPVFKALP